MAHVICMRDVNGNIYATYMPEGELNRINKLNKILEKEEEITLKELKEMFVYNPETGDLIYRKFPMHRKTDPFILNRKVGNTDSKGYKRVNIKGKTYSLTYLIWYIHYGKKPKKEIDHINRNPSDNRIINLRLVTHQQNCLNRGINKNNTSGVTGVTWNKQINKWQAQITVNKKTILLGHFLVFENAVKARKSAEDFAGITNFKY